MKSTAFLVALSGSIALALPHSADREIGTCHSIRLPGDGTIAARSLSVTREGRAGVGPWPNGELHVFFPPDGKSRTKLLPTLQSALGIWSSSSPRLSHLRIVVDDKQTRTSMVTTFVSNNRQCTTIGYDINGGMKMDFDPSSTVGHADAVDNMVHEIGHALGLYHEHQRPDAPTYVKFNCDALKDYDDVKKTAKKNGDDMADLCENEHLAGDEKYNFTSTQFIPFTGSTTKDWSGTFDFDSVMMYGSYYGAKSSLFGKKPKVLTKKNGNEIVPKSRPSRGDVERMVQLYG